MVYAKRCRGSQVLLGVLMHMGYRGIEQAPGKDTISICVATEFMTLRSNFLHVLCNLAISCF